MHCPCNIMITYSMIKRHKRIEMKDFNYYATATLPWPSRSAFVRYNVFDGPNILSTGLPEAQVKQLMKINPTAQYATYVMDDKYNAARKAYKDEETRLFNEFVQDAFEECGVTNHPKADKAMSIAWEHAHSEGYASVYEFFEELCELLK